MLMTKTSIYLLDYTYFMFEFKKPFFILKTVGRTLGFNSAACNISIVALCYDVLPIPHNVKKVSKSYFLFLFV